MTIKIIILSLHGNEISNNEERNGFVKKTTRTLKEKSQIRESPNKILSSHKNIIFMISLQTQNEIWNKDERNFGFVN